MPRVATVGLTDMQAKVLWHYAAGSSIKETSAALDIAPATVKLHRKQMFLKTGIETLPELVAYGIKHGHIDRTHPLVRTVVSSIGTNLLEVDRVLV